MSEEERERIWYLYHGKLDLSGDDWVDHLVYSKSLNLPYDAPAEDRKRVSRLKVEDLISRMERSEQPVQEWLGDETYSWTEPERVKGEYKFGGELSFPKKAGLSLMGMLHNAVQGFDNPMPLREGIKKRQFPNWADTQGLLQAIWD